MHASIRRPAIAVSAALALAGAGLVLLPPDRAAAATLTDAWTDASRYAPGQQATVTARTDGTGPVTFTLTHLGDVVDTATVQADGSGQVTWKVTPPATDYRGYLVEIEAEGSRTQTAIDVSSNWARFPRFGFLAFYGTGISNDEAKGDIAELSQRYHINALQYYDWLWKHEKPVKHTDGGGIADTWTAWNGDTISSHTVRNYIGAGHDRGVAAMPYQMSYAALNDYDHSEVSPDWRLFNSPGGQDAWTYTMLPGQILHLMNPENTAWQDHIIDEYKDSVASMGFDGAHLDQIGYWSEKYDKAGNQVNRPNGFAQLTDRTKQALPAGRNAVGFNAVDGYGDAELARTSADYLYTELWANFETNTAVKDYLERQRQASGGKPHVTPAYMNRPNTPDGTPNDNSVFDTTSVQLANAMFAANGSHHLELGPNDHMLNTEYFLNKDKTMSEELKAWQKTYYDVITAYENLFYGPDLHTASNRVAIDGQPTSTDGAGNTIWTNTMRNGDTDVLHLINLLGNDGKWRDAGTATPPTRTDLPVKYYLRDGQQAPAELHIGSPDRNGGRSAEIPFTTGSDSGGRYLSFTVPELTNWDFVYFDHTADEGGGDPEPPTGKQLVNAGGKCAEAADGASTNGTPAQLATCTEADRGTWAQQGTELRVLGKCLDVVGGHTANGTKAHLWDCGGWDSQKWAFQPDGTLKHLKSGRCLDIEHQSSDDGAALHLWDCGTWNSQKWSLKP